MKSDLPAFSAETVVVGIGNVVHSDDGAGVQAFQMLRDTGKVPESVSMVEGGTLGLELISYLQNARRIILLDAVEAGAEPGATFRFEADDLRGMSGSWNVHQLGVGDLLNALSLIAPAPQEIVLLGVQPESTAWGTTCTERIRQALPKLVQAALDQLDCWSRAEAA